MNPRQARMLTRLYPSAWRQRYGDEFATFLSETDAGLSQAFNVVWRAAREHFNPAVGAPMCHILSSPLQSLSKHAPWAVFSFGPCMALICAYVMACLILVSGWQMFLPQAKTPFAIPLHGAAVFYFGAGRLLYYGAPIAVGWATAWLAARWRTKAVWPAIGFVVLSLASVAVRVEANTGRHGKNVNFGFYYASVASMHGLLIAAVVFAVMGVPFLLLRLASARKRVPA